MAFVTREGYHQPMKEQQLHRFEDFRLFLLEKLIPDLKICVKSLADLEKAPPKKRKRSAARAVKIYDDGVKIIALMYQTFPRHLLQTDERLAQEIGRSLSAADATFFIECSTRFQKSTDYQQLCDEENRKDFGGMCFSAAYKFMTTQQRDGHQLLLVHGWVFNPLIQKYMIHAWTEEDDLTVHDISQAEGARCQTVANFYEIGNVLGWAMRRYSLQETSSHAADSGHYGPWDSELFDRDFLDVSLFDARTKTHAVTPFKLKTN